MRDDRLGPDRCRQKTPFASLHPCYHYTIAVIVIIYKYTIFSGLTLKSSSQSTEKRGEISIEEGAVAAEDVPLPLTCAHIFQCCYYYYHSKMEREEGKVSRGIKKTCVCVPTPYTRGEEDGEGKERRNK